MTLADLERATSTGEETAQSSGTAGPLGSPIYEELIAELGDPKES